MMAKVVFSVSYLNRPCINALNYYLWNTCSIKRNYEGVACVYEKREPIFNVVGGEWSCGS